MISKTNTNNNKCSNKVSPKGKNSEYKPVAGPSSAPDRLQSKGSNSVNSGNMEFSI